MRDSDCGRCLVICTLLLHHDCIGTLGDQRSGKNASDSNGLQRLAHMTGWYALRHRKYGAA